MRSRRVGKLKRDEEARGSVGEDALRGSAGAWSRLHTTGLPFLDYFMQFAVDAASVAPSPAPAATGPKSQWTAANVILSIFLFLVAGLAEIGGGWLVWQVGR
jgi:Uncharacterised BCR, YnfA/UPF0060 family